MEIKNIGDHKKLCALSMEIIDLHRKSTDLFEQCAVASRVLANAAKEHDEYFSFFHQCCVDDLALSIEHFEAQQKFDYDIGQIDPPSLPISDDMWKKKDKLEGKVLDYFKHFKKTEEELREVTTLLASKSEESAHLMVKVFGKD